MSLRGATVSAYASRRSTQVLVLGCGGTCLAIPIQVLRGVQEANSTARHGTVTWAGIDYPITDLVGSTKLPGREAPPESRTIFCTVGDVHRAITVDQVFGLMTLEQAQIRPLPPHFSGQEREWFSGLFFFEDKVALLLNPKGVLAGDRLGSK